MHILLERGRIVEILLVQDYSLIFTGVVFISTTFAALLTTRRKHIRPPDTPLQATQRVKVVRRAISDFVMLETDTAVYLESIRRHARRQDLPPEVVSFFSLKRQFKGNSHTPCTHIDEPLGIEKSVLL